MNYPKIDDEIYKEIESFEDYEYTNCIAYEMMIRSQSCVDNIIKTIKNIYILEIKLNHFRDICFKYQSNSIGVNNENFTQAIESTTNIERQVKEEYLNIGINNEAIEELDFLLRLPFLNDEQKNFLEESIESLRIKLNGGRGYCNPIDIYEENYTLEEYQQSLDSYLEHEYSSDFEILRQDIEDDIHDGFKLTSTTWLPPLKNAYFEDIKKLTEMNTPPYLVLTGQYEHHNVIKPYFKRHIIPIKKPRQVNLDINLALPIEELKAYIEQIKNEYNKDNTIIKTPLEVIDEELDKAEEIKSKGLRKGKEKRKKAMANAFYVYDIYKIIEQEYSTKTYNLKAERDAKINSIAKIGLNRTPMSE